MIIPKEDYNSDKIETYNYPRGGPWRNGEQCGKSEDEIKKITETENRGNYKECAKWCQLNSSGNDDSCCVVKDKGETCVLLKAGPFEPASMVSSFTLPVPENYFGEFVGEELTGPWKNGYTCSQAELLE